MATPAFLPAFPPHSPIEEVFPDVFLVEGGFRFAPGMSISRNMTIVRQGTELTLVNSVRLSKEREAELEKLGKVTHLVRIGEFHGADDPYYVDRYAPTLWAPPGMKHASGLATKEELKGTSSPIAGSEVFRFEKGEGIEVALVMKNGALVTCDAYQNWTTFDGCSFLGRQMMRTMGFQPLHIGAPWLKRMGQGVRHDFDRLLERPFQHLVPGHGTVVRETAKDGLRVAMGKRFVG
jgi:hypothetical protein